MREEEEVNLGLGEKVLETACVDLIGFDAMFFDCKEKEGGRKEKDNLAAFSYLF